ncbi:hypothetical protein [Bacillus sp. XF8]|uniref:hypothetical protein n=1 Tax=Bacillus sp. XF8 TaxID=2819289 RepID=UPI001AA01985|nr:hypothetical protein [Bacillus sp. XF8]MBO1582682.1 hypothetical protein [Bacillus sp. XF8]
MASLKLYTFNVFLAGVIFINSLSLLVKGHYLISLLAAVLLVSGYFVERRSYKQFKEALTYRNEN